MLPIVLGELANDSGGSWDVLERGVVFIAIALERDQFSDEGVAIGVLGERFLINRASIPPVLLAFGKHSLGIE